METFSYKNNNMHNDFDRRILITFAFFISLSQVHQTILAEYCIFSGQLIKINEDSYHL